MYIKRLELKNYRNYSALDLELEKNVNVFVGDNAQGKTNILEAIYYCGFGKSHRTNKDREIIKWNENNSIIKLHVCRKRLDKKIDINILKDGKKAIKINSIKISKISDLIGVFNVVMFSPEDLRIVKESPGVRRRFLDMELCQLDKKYYYNLVQYNKVLHERNSILKSRNMDISMMDIYDIQLSKFASYIIQKRLYYIEKLNHYGKNIHKDITSSKEDIFFKYISSVKFSGISSMNEEVISSEISKEIGSMVKDNSQEEIASAVLDNLHKSRKNDFERGITGIGVHRDDLSILINGIDAKSFASQGQQRTAVLTMKFSSLDIIQEITGEYPVLLLDDVLSELDFNRKKYILSSISDIQTIITCTGIEDIETYIKNDSRIFKVKDGTISM